MALCPRCKRDARRSWLAGPALLVAVLGITLSNAAALLLHLPRTQPNEPTTTALLQRALLSTTAAPAAPARPKPRAAAAKPHGHRGRHAATRKAPPPPRLATTCEDRRPRTAHQTPHQTPHQTAHQTPPRAPADRPLPWPTAILGNAGSESHDPDVLLARALRLHSDGIGITLDRRTVSERELLAALKQAGLSIQPVRRFGETIGFLVRDPQKRDLLRKLGLQSGDLLTAVNGHALAAPDAILSAYSQSTKQRKALIELLRDGRRVALHLQIQ